MKCLMEGSVERVGGCLSMADERGRNRVGVTSVLRVDDEMVQKGIDV